MVCVSVLPLAFSHFPRTPQVIVGYMLKMVCSYPLSNFPLRVTIHYQVYKDAPASLGQHVAETLVPFVIAVGVALCVTNVSVLFSFVGAIARTSISFLFPAAIMWRALRLSTLDKCVCGVVAAFGAIVTLLGFAATVRLLA